MLKPVFTEEMQSAIMQAAPDDAGLLSQAIISEFMGLEPVALPKHLELIMSVFRQQIKKLKESYNKKVADTRRRVERHRKKEVSEESKSADNSCNALHALHALQSDSLYTIYNHNTKTKDNKRYYVSPKKENQIKEKKVTNSQARSMALVYGGDKSHYVWSQISDYAQIYDDKPEAHIAADLCHTNSQHSINTWRKYSKLLAEVEPYAFRELIAELYGEMQAGEIPDNPAACFTWRVQQKCIKLGINYEQ